MSSMKWPLTSDLLKHPESSWSEAMMAMMRLNMASEEGSEFKYGDIEPNQIRLLGLPPAARHEPLEATMFVCNFPKPSLAGWEALSYTWGDATQLSGTIMIDKRQKKITRNLETALRHLRDETEVKLLWIDALCIDQENSEEKGHQLRLMRFIYEEAAWVRVWLGEYEEQGKVAMEFLHSIQDGEPDDDWILNALHGSSATLQSVNSLFCRPYWKRVWIVQELVCASRPILHCGDASVKWATILRLQKVLNQWSRETNKPTADNPRSRVKLALGPGYATLLLTESLRGARREVESLKDIDRNSSLFGLLIGMDDFDVSNPKDRIYGLLGLVEDVNLQHGVFPIDYSLTDEQVYIDAAKYIITVSERLDILCLIRPGQALRSKYKLPSWCPDWTLDLRKTNRLLEHNMRKENFASWDTKAKSSFSQENNAMTVSGVILSSIKTLGGEFDWEKIYWFQLLALANESDDTFTLEGQYSVSEREAIGRWLQVSGFGDPKLKASMQGQLVCSTDLQRPLLRHLQTMVPHFRDDPVVDKRLDIFWRTLMTENRVETTAETLQLKSMFNAFLGWRDSKVPESSYDGHAGLEFTHRFRREVASYAHGRQFFKTSDGRLGWAPYDAQEGDIVCVLFGCGVPVTLRPVDDHYVIVGETYIYGFMRGEAIKEMEERTLKEEKFVIH